MWTDDLKSVTTIDVSGEKRDFFVKWINKCNHFSYKISVQNLKEYIERTQTLEKFDYFYCVYAFADSKVKISIQSKPKLDDHLEQISNKTCLYLSSYVKAYDIQGLLSDYKYEGEKDLYIPLDKRNNVNSIHRKSEGGTDYFVERRPLGTRYFELEISQETQDFYKLIQTLKKKTYHGHLKSVEHIHIDHSSENWTRDKLNKAQVKVQVSYLQESTLLTDLGTSEEHDDEFIFYDFHCDDKSAIEAFHKLD